MTIQRKEALCIFTGFAYLTNILDANGGEIPHRLKIIFYNATKITLMYEHLHDEMIEEVNKIVRNYPNTEIDLMLASVTFFSEYIEQMRGRRRTFNPMEYKHIKAIQDEIEDDLYTHGEKQKVFDTYDYCHDTVKNILKG